MKPLNFPSSAPNSKKQTFKTVEAIDGDAGEAVIRYGCYSERFPIFSNKLVPVNRSRFP